MLQRSMAGDVLAEALTGRLYPEELQARLRPLGSASRAAVLAFAPPDPAVAAPLVERILAREDLLGERAGGPEKNGTERRRRPAGQPGGDSRRPAVRGGRWRPLAGEQCSRR